MDDANTPTARPPASPLSWPFRWAWQLFVLIAGIATIVVGVVLLPLPGPGSLVIFAGIGILSTEFIWAKQLLTRIRIWFKQQFRRWKNWKKPNGK